VTKANVLADVAEIHRLLNEAYDHYFANSDGYCKSSEGQVSLHWPTYFAMRYGEIEPTCSVYSYVLGPSRNHDFESTTEALAAVREWHAEEMAHDYRDSFAEHCPATAGDSRCDLDAGHSGCHQNAEATHFWSTA
jgi:hypothetical protein